MDTLFLSRKSSVPGSIPCLCVADDARHDPYPFSSWFSMMAAAMSTNAFKLVIYVIIIIIQYTYLTHVLDISVLVRKRLQNMRSISTWNENKYRILISNLKSFTDLFIWSFYFYFSLVGPTNSNTREWYDTSCLMVLTSEFPFDWSQY